MRGSGHAEAAIVLGARVRGLREDQGWSQDDLAGVVGMHRNQISSIERGVGNRGRPTDPTLSTLRALAAALRTPLSGLVGILDDPGETLERMSYDDIIDAATLRLNK